MNPANFPDFNADSMQAWVKSKRALRCPGDLAGSVMAALEDVRVETPTARPNDTWICPWWKAALSSVWVRAAVLGLAAVGGLGRVALVLIWLLWT